MKNISLIFLLFCFIGKGISQNKLPINQIAKEKIYMHYNASYYLSGDKMYYTFYCLNQETKILSNLSKLAYVELLDSNKQTIFKHKIKLEKGVGYGDFFIPSSIKTGSYKIIGYTNWIKNFGVNSFFIGDVFIVNPYQDNSSFVKDSLSNTKSLEVSNNKLSLISIETNKENFSKRELVKLKINGIQDELSYGNYSFSVRKKGSMNLSNTKNYLDKNQKTKANQLKYIPEFRGEIIQGNVTDIASGKPVFNCFLSFSIPGKNYIFKIVKTSSDGNFFIPISENHNKSDAILVITDKNRENYRITLKEDLPIDYSILEFKEFQISRKNLDYLSLKSTDLQIENSYNFLKQDSLIKLKQNKRFFKFNGEKVITYNLDDYTRFKTLKETLTEIVVGAYHYKRKGNYYLGILEDEFILKDNKPLILIDGVRILDVNNIINFNTRKVNRIILSKDNYSYGNELFSGIIAIETYKGDYSFNKHKENYKTIKLFKPQRQKKYYQPDYKNKKQIRIPDFRYQLFWEPNLKLNQTNTELEFYTSDKTGVFEISVKGFTNSGTFVSITKEFTVK